MKKSIKFISIAVLFAAISCTSQNSSPSSASPSNSGNASVSNSSSKISQTVIAKNLDTPWAIAFAPDGRMFVTERGGKIRVIKDGILQENPWLTIEVIESGESGLLGIAVDPDFAKNGFVYAAYTYRAANGDFTNRLVRIHEDPANKKVSIDKILIDNVPGNSNHNGGRVKFGPDGKLYWAMGEMYEVQLAQDLKSLNGKILRLNSDGSIPADNPFANSYIYSFGHRNVQGLAWQPGTGTLFATEHGPSGGQGCCRDEVNIIDPGKNYGWPEITGEQSKEGMVTPLLNSGGTTTWAPGGATFVTKGKWAGSLLFTGLRGQSLYKLNFDSAQKSKISGQETFLANELGRLRDIAESPDGQLYLLTSNRDGRGSPSGNDDQVIRLSIL